MSAFLDKLLGQASRAVGVVGRAIPPCYICGKPGAQFCSECGRVACHLHAFTCFGSLQSACTQCMSKPFAWVIDSPSSEWQYDSPPWEVLGVVPNASREDVVVAWKKRSREVHPDIGGNTEDQKKVNAAYAEMLKRAA